MLKTLTTTLFFILALSVGKAGASEGYLLNQAYFEDVSNELTFDQARSEKYTPYEGWLIKGYSDSTYWIRLSIKPSKQDLVLRIRPAYVESIELFNSADLGRSRITGARHPFSDADIKTYGHHFVLDASAQEQQIYLKVKTSRTVMLHFNALPLSEYLTVDQNNSLFLVGYIVFTLALALGLLGSWITNRELVLGVFTIQQFFAFLHTLFLYGYARIFFDSYVDVRTLNFLIHIVVVIYPLIGIWANKLLLEEYSLKPLYKILFNSLAIIPIINIALLASGKIGLALKINASLIILMMALCLVASLFGTKSNEDKKISNFPIALLRIYYTSNFILWVMVVLPVLGIGTVSEFTFHANLTYNILSSLIFFWILQYRAKLILKNEHLKYAVLEKQANEERRKREEQGKLMAMLTHEIRTPLSVLKLVVDRKVSGSELEDFANRAVSNIDSIIDKCIQLDRLDLNLIQIERVKFNLNDLLHSVINDCQQESKIVVTGDKNLIIDSDSEMMRVIMSNLVNNALKYSMPNSEIKINIELSNVEKVLGFKMSIQNEIEELNAPDLAQVFEKYYRSPSAGKTSGSGLGLFLVKELANVLGGNVKCSINNNIITFELWIPA